MDMQMPVMDGVTATQEMRKVTALAQMPIVAMTANAMEQDRRKCLDAGMNDFLVKPIDQEAMWTMLARWIQPERIHRGDHPATVEAPPAAAAVDDGVPRDIDGLDTALGLSRMLNKRPLYLAMLHRWCAGQRSVAADIRRALESADRTTAERLAHTTKAVSGSIGAVRVQAQAEAVETALREGHDPAQTDAVLALLEAEVGSLVSALDARLAGSKVAG
jgi:two-component system sensor histidine kinase/response regulator